MSGESLETLEERVREAGLRLGSLREENEDLRSRVEELERELDALRGASGPARDRDREELRRRVDRLVARLAQLAGA